MKIQVFLASVTEHLVPHRLKHLRITGNWADSEELQPVAPQTSDTNPTDKDTRPLFHREKENAECLIESILPVLLMTHWLLVGLSARPLLKRSELMFRTSRLVIHLVDQTWKNHGNSDQDSLYALDRLCSDSMVTS